MNIRHDEAEELRQKNRDLNAIMANLPGGVMCCENSPELKLLEYSDGFLKMFGYTKEEIEERFQNSFEKMIYPEDLEPVWEDVRRQMMISNMKKIEYRVVCKDGSLIIVQDHGQLVEREGREVFYCVLSDVTEQRRTTEALELSLERHRIIMEQTRDIIFEYDWGKNQFSFSDNWEKKFGYKPFDGDSVKQAVSRGYIYKDDIGRLWEIKTKIQEHTPYVEGEIRIRKADGCYIWCKIRATLQVSGNGRAKKTIGVIIDIDNEKRKTQKLREWAERDTLTGLYNKGAAEQRMERCLQEMEPGEACAFFILDVDDFKHINDTYGHMSGDVFLSQIAEDIKGIFRKDDIIGRVGGDEFAILMRNVSDKKMVADHASKIVSTFGRKIYKSCSQTSCSVGVALAPEHGREFGDLYHKADEALYAAKAEGKNRYKIYSQSIETPEELSRRRLLKAAGQAEDMAVPAVVRGQDAFAEYVFDVLYHEEDTSAAINHVLGVIGRQSGACRVYIFEESADGKVWTNTFEWCGFGIEPKSQNEQKVSGENMLGYYDNFNEDGVFFCRSREDILKLGQSWAKDVATKSMWQYLIQDRGRNYGFIGLDKYHENRQWLQEHMDTLVLAVKIISMFLIKYRLQEQLDKLEK